MKNCMRKDKEKIETLASQHKKFKLWHPKEKKNRNFGIEKIKIETLASKRRKNNFGTKKK